MVAMLGEGAAQTLGISSTRGSRAIFVNGIALTLNGIIGPAQQDAGVLANVVVRHTWRSCSPPEPMSAQ